MENEGDERDGPDERAGAKCSLKFGHPGWRDMMGPGYPIEDLRGPRHAAFVVQHVEDACIAAWLDQKLSGIVVEEIIAKANEFHYS